MLDVTRLHNRTLASFQNTVVVKINKHKQNTSYLFLLTNIILPHNDYSSTDVFVAPQYQLNLVP